MWLVFVVACFALGNVTGTQQADDSDSDIGEVSRADNIVAAGNFDDPAVESVLITARSGGLDQAQATKAAAAVTSRMRSLSDVAEVAKPVLSPKQDALIVRAT